MQFQFGSLGEEFPEQVMSMMYLTGDEKVLELGGNIGRNSMIIAHILNKKDNHNFVSFETNNTDADKLKYNIDFDTLVIDCEGAFYYILQDTPEILDGINLLIMENDYFRDSSHKEYIFSTLRNNNYECIFQRALDNPNIPDFYQVWKLKE